ncbi:peptide-N4-(N-acetyl-beta-glucosaminyl)asparagine amidase A [Arachis stenosperma]|uniref:peptide-N4-(N-acetyl-beta- glucosaminyl)asparagine amidase A n=1 Tax=Arachis stenosperma TaxID=217475 RepID=UPI0025AD5CA0|nr:peptide-N4-(N-acetyl-beta-glucosaminyl)asparagine amidase A [Arachis stenosperma]
MGTFLCFLFLLLLLTYPPSTSATVSRITHEDRFTLSASLHRGLGSREYVEVNYPPPSLDPTPSCSHRVLHHSFGDTINSPPYSTPYSPPPRCPPPWSRVLLHFHASSRGDQYDRIAAIWLGGAELFRTSTAEPTASGIFWNVRKDITRYSSLLARSDLELTMMLENIINNEFTGVYHVTVTFLYYNANSVKVPFRPCGGEGLTSNRRSRSLMNRDPVISLDVDESPADLIIPIADDGERGFWFKVENERDLHSRKIRIPRNTHRVVLELYVSFHGNDEFWYTNPPNSYIISNGLATERGNGPYREVFVTIDGDIVAWEVPFPVIFTGGINPLSWAPVVAIGAFNLPSYDIDITPYLGKLLDGKEHKFALGVSQGISYWLLNANLHVWLDHASRVVQASYPARRSPETNIERQEEFLGLNGEFEVEAEKETMVTGWVTSSAGNVTTSISQMFSLRNFMKFQEDGTYKMVKHKFKAKTKVKVKNSHGEMIAKLKVKRKYPLRVITWTEPILFGDDDTDDDDDDAEDEKSYRLVTNVSHTLEQSYVSSCISRSIENKQDSKGWMDVKGHNVLSGQANTKQNYSYIDRFNCYSRDVAAANGRLIRDESSVKCENFVI